MWSKILTELLCLICLALFVWVMIQKHPVIPYEDLLPVEKYCAKHFRSGDLIVTFGNYLDLLHPGHLAIVVEGTEYHQLYVWELDSQEKTYVLKPLMPYLQRAYQDNRKVFVRHLQGPKLDLLPILKTYRHVHYEYQGILEYFNVLLHKYLYLPGIVTQPLDATACKRHFYCSEAVFRVLVDVGILDLGVFQNVPDIDQDSLEAEFHLIYPKYLLHPEFCINDFIYSPYTYTEARAVKM